MQLQNSIIDKKKHFNEFLLLISLVIGIFFSYKYWGLPPVRNSVIAIKTAVALENMAFNTDNFVKTTAYTYGKPIGLPILLFLVNKVTSAPHSFYLASLLVGMAYCLSCWILSKIYFEHLGKNKSLFIIFLLFAPWTFTHFYGLGPDGPYMILINLFLIFNKIKKDKNSVWASFLVFMVIYFSALVRLHGLVLIIAWFILNQKILRSNIKNYYADYAGLVVFGFLMILSLLGKNPLMNLTDNAGGGRHDYFKFIFSIMAVPDYFFNVIQFFIFIVSTFSLMPIWYQFKNSYAANKELIQCTVVIALSLLFYRWTYHNTRYFFILIPFIGLILFEKKNFYSRKLLALNLVVFIVGNYVINVNPDSIPFIKKAENYENSSLDNIRLFRRVSDASNIEIIKATDCSLRRCYVVNNYYHNAYFQIYEIMNYWDKEKNVQYSEDLNFPMDMKTPLTVWYKNSDTDNIIPFIVKKFPSSAFEVTQLSSEIFNIEHK